jgi:hypothetical protein
LSLGFELKASKGIDLDTDELSISAQHAVMIKNMSRYAKDNPANQQGSEGNNANCFTPNEGSQIIGAIPGAPAGEHWCIGFREDKELNEGYVFCFNTLGNHFIYRINGNNTLQMVKIDRDFDFVLDPLYYVSPGRCTVFSYKVFNRATNRDEIRRDMVFTDNRGPIRYLNVEDCIATGGFDANRFAIFRYSKPYKEYLINHGLPYSFACIGVEPVPTTPADRMKENRLDFRSIRFRIKRFDVWNRESEHGVISTPYYLTSVACLSASGGRARCLKLSIEKGPPTISKIQLEISTCSANTQDLTVDTDWFIYDTIDVYDQSNPNLQWWERPLNPELKYDAATDRFTYIFCNDKNCKPIPKEETNRIQNPIPITAAYTGAMNNSLVTANHRKKYPPLTKDILKKLSFSVEKPQKSTACNPKGVNVTVYAVITAIEEGEKVVSIRKDQENIIFGLDKTDIIYEIGQQFPKGQEGFIGYFAGTREYVISKQCIYNRQTGEIKETGLDFTGLTQAERLNSHAIQKFEFKNVPPGKKIFRIASHKSSPSDEYQKTSTNVYGITTLKDHRVDLSKAAIHELIIDACNGDVDLKDSPMLIFDLTSEEGGIRRITNAVMGYLYEDEVSKIPVERARVDTTDGTWHSEYTDHNGYYWAVTKKKGWRAQMFGRKDGKANQLLAQSLETFDSPGARFRDEKLYVYKGTNEYKATDRILIKGRVLLCNSQTGVSGVPITLSNGSTTTTDNNGNYTLIMHDGGESKFRLDRLMLTQGGKCILTNCEGQCSYCFDDIFVSAPAYNGAQRTVTVRDFFVNIQNVNLRGPQNGGRYEMSLQAFDWLGRTIGAEGLPWFLDIPSIQETQVFGFSRIAYAFASDVVFPEYVKHLTIAISRNLNWSDFVTWYADKIEMIDNSGNINKASPTQIRIYYRGMVEYNIQNNLSTNTTWQVIDPETNSTIIGDRVEFVVNGDGKIFADRIVSLVKHDKEGQYFTIDYIEELKGLSDGAMIKLLRPRECTTTEQYTEQCLEIELVNRRIPTSRLKGYIDYFDSYMFNRQIPIPQYDDDNNKVPELTNIKNVPIPFEHHSPSDFWGDHCSSRGRYFVKDPYANIQFLSTEVGVSKAMVNDGIVHGISYFTDNDFKIFDKNEWGGITYIQPMLRVMLVICEHDNFLVGFDDNALRAQSDGRIVAVPAGQRFGDPQRKNGSKFGCQPYDVNTICELNGVVMHIDSAKAAWVYNDTGNAVDMSVMGCNGWLKDKIKETIRFNSTNKEYRRYFHACFDPRSEQCLLTSFKIPIYKAQGMAKLTIADYVNQLREKDVAASETMALNPFTKEIVQMYSFTPEYFGTLSGHAFDKQLISFKAGVPWLHHRTFRNTTPVYMNFFGVQCEPIYEVVLNVEHKKTKLWLCTRVFCQEQIFFCDRVLTNAGQRSRLLKAAFEKQLHYWSADFKGDLNTKEEEHSAGLADASLKIYEGNSLYGNWIKVRYVGDPKVNGKYFEFNGVTIHVVGAEPS